VGYYIHKFNKSSKKGEPIVFQAHEKLDPKALAINSLIKSLMLNQLTETIKSGDIDKVYKVLSVYKLAKELERDLLPTPEEIKSFYENLNYVIQQWINMTKVVS
jgi:hypothetical protein